MEDSQQAMELAFNTKDVIYIVSLLVGALTGWFTLKFTVKAMQTEIDRTKEDVVKNEKTMFKKFTGVHARMEKTDELTKNEFTSLNNAVNEMKLGIVSIDSKLTMLIDSQKKP